MLVDILFRIVPFTLIVINIYPRTLKLILPVLHHMPRPLFSPFKSFLTKITFVDFLRRMLDFMLIQIDFGAEFHVTNGTDNIFLAHMKCLLVEYHLVRVGEFPPARVTRRSGNAMFFFHMFRAQMRSDF